MMNLYRRITDKNLLIRRIAMSANRVTDEKCMEEKPEFQQLDFFTDYKALQQQMEEEKSRLQEERQMQETLLNIKKKFGKNAVLKGMSLQEGATARDKNNQIGGHKA